MERGGDASCGLATGTKTGVVLVMRRRAGNFERYRCGVGMRLLVELVGRLVVLVKG
jgi:hypothetical protein